METNGDRYATFLWELINREEKMYEEINSSLEKIALDTDPQIINNISIDLKDKYEKALCMNLKHQAELIKKYELLPPEEKENFITSLQKFYTKQFSEIRQFDNSSVKHKREILDKYFSLMSNFNEDTAPDSVNLAKLSAVKRIIYPAGKELLEKAVLRLGERKLKVDDSKIEHPFAISPHTPTDSPDYPKKEDTPKYPDAVGPHRGIFPYPGKDHNLDMKKVNSIYLQDPEKFTEIILDKEQDPSISYKKGVKKGEEGSKIKELLMIIDPTTIQVQIGENKEGKLKFFASPMQIAIHHEELHMVRGLRGAQIKENALPKQLERVYHNAEEFMTIKAAKHTERDIDSQMGLPLRVGHTGVTLGTPYEEWLTNLIATQMIHKTKNLSNIDFTPYNWDMSQEYYKNADFSNSDLSRKLLLESNFENATLNGAILNYTELQGANLTNAKLQNIESLDINFEKAILSNADFTGARLTGANFTGAALSGANFENTILRDAHFDNTDLSGVNFKNASLDGADLTKAKNIDKADFTDVDLRNVKLPAEFEHLKNTKIAQYH